MDQAIGRNSKLRFSLIIEMFIFIVVLLITAFHTMKIELSY